MSQDGGGPVQPADDDDDALTQPTGSADSERWLRVGFRYRYRSRQPGVHHSTKSDPDWLTLGGRPRRRGGSAVPPLSPAVVAASML